MNQPEGAERESIEHDRDLAWELYDVQPRHPRIPELAQSVLARAPQFTGMIILIALHREACGEVDEARRLLQDLMGRRDRQYVNAVRKLRDLEYSDRNHAESLRLAEIVLREDPEAGWMDRMELASAMAYVHDPESAWRLLDEAVEFCGRTDPDGYPDALGQRATRFLATGAPPDRFLAAAEEAVAADPTESLLSLALAYAYLFHYRPYEAAEILGRLLREDPTDETAQGAMTIAKAFIDPLENSEYTIEDVRRLGMGEFAWRILRDTLFETGMDRALLALDSVMPQNLEDSLLPGAGREEARASGGDDKLLTWHDGQQLGTGHLWATGEPFRLMTGAEVHAMEEAIEADPAAWPQWDGETDYFTLLFTDDAGSYLIEGTGGRVYRRSPGQDDLEVAPSLADWLWDRVAAFGGTDARPGRGTRATPADPDATPTNPDVTVALIRSIIDTFVDGGDEDWESFSMVLSLWNGLLSNTSGFRYSPTGEVVPTACRPSRLKPAVDAYLASRYAPGDPLPVTILVQFDRVVGRYELTIEDTDDQRWKVTPMNIDEMPGEIRPRFR